MYFPSYPRASRCSWIFLIIFIDNTPVIYKKNVIIVSVNVTQISDSGYKAIMIYANSKHCFILAFRTALFFMNSSVRELSNYILLKEPPHVYKVA